MPSRLTIAKSDIVALFDEQANPVFKQSQLGQILEHHRSEWRLPQSLRLTGFIEYLIKNSKLKKVRVDLPHRPETLYVWGQASAFCMASSLKTGGYLSHYTAMQIHELTDQSPEILYVNHEQRPQPKPSGPLTQEAVDRAFKAPQRVSKNLASMGRRKVRVLNGKHTGRYGVEELHDQNRHPVQVTTLERTLIDIVVRPGYSGGVTEVLEAYRRAAERVQVNKLLATLRKLDYVYPYQQAIGFYMDRSGAYPERRLAMLEAERSEIDFYLTYAMSEVEYSDRWQIYFPPGL
ncbi:MAG: type IV toxin-antitoxin system AbiEi family antitoxin [Phycisphaerales bacterium JB065]